MGNSRTPTILVATSDAATRQHLVDYLAAAGYPLRVVERGSDVLLAVAEDAAHLVILDLAIGEPSGASTVEIVRKMRPRLPVIVLSADHSVETGRQILQHGPLYYLLKPFNPDDLIQIVRIALPGARQLGAGSAA